MHLIRRLTRIRPFSHRSYATPSVYNHVQDLSRQYLPAKGWTDRQMRRNFGDTVSTLFCRPCISSHISSQLHEQEELYSMWGPDIPVVPPPIALRQVTLVALGLISFGFFIKYALVPDPHFVRRQYPYSGLVVELGGLEENKVRLIPFPVTPVCLMSTFRCAFRRGLKMRGMLINYCCCIPKISRLLLLSPEHRSIAPPLQGNSHRVTIGVHMSYGHRRSPCTVA
jgi:hypothetical protein